MKILCETCIHFFIRKYIDFCKKETTENECLILQKSIPESQRTVECSHYDSGVIEANLN